MKEYITKLIKRISSVTSEPLAEASWHRDNRVLSIISSHSGKLTDDVSFGFCCLQVCSGASSGCLMRSVCGEFLRLVNGRTNGFPAGLCTAVRRSPVSNFNV